MSPLRSNDLEFESLKSFDITERHTHKNGKAHNVTVATTALPSTDDNHHQSRQQPRNTSPVLRFMDEWWIIELFAWTVSVASLVAMVAILQVHNGKPTPKWAVTIRHRSVEITINTVISLFATVMKSSLMVPVAAAISQLKWNWFYQGRPLTDFQLFDSAKQGPLGAITLLWSMRGRGLVCLGSLIVIISLAIDPFIQNLIAYPQVPMTVGQSTIPRTEKYNQSAPGVILGVTSIDPSMLGAIYSGIFDANNTFDMSPVCPSGNCTWPPYTSLGVCSKCVDKTSAMSKSCSTYELPVYDNTSGNIISNSTIPYCNYTMLDDGPSLSGLGMGSGNSEAAMNISYAYAFQEMPAGGPITVLNAMEGRWGSGTDNADHLQNTSATQCALYYCANKYEAAVTKGTLHETVLSSWHNDSATFEAMDGSYQTESAIYLKPPSSFLNANGPAPEFTVTWTSAFSLALQFQNMWMGNVTLGGDMTTSPSASASGDIVNILYHGGIRNIPIVMSNLAKSMTRNMRNADTTHPAVGQVLQDVPHVMVRWQWIALPCALQLVTLIFLVGTMFDSARRGAMLWKSSSLATFYHPLTHDGRAKLGATMHPRDMEKTAAEMAVKWERTDRGYRLVES